MESVKVTINGQGKEISIESIRQFIEEHPEWHRTKLSRELCEEWRWCGPNGQIKDMACRDLLLKLERAGHIVLPPRQRRSTNEFRNRQQTLIFHDTEEIACNLKSLTPIQVVRVNKGSDNDLFRHLISHYHYLGYRNTVGENMKYLIRDKKDRPLGCLLFGSAAWKTAPRDGFIGWADNVRMQNLSCLTNNTRFLILPWVRVPHLASHILSQVTRRTCNDWEDKYGHPVYLLETFVDTSRYRGICYQAANWQFLGQTKGRTRNDRSSTIKASVKDIYVYPLYKNFRKRLCNGNTGKGSPGV